MSEFQALLDWRNTPTAEIGASPAQRLMSRRCKTLLPVAGSLLQPSVPTEADTRKLLGTKQQQQHYYNKQVRPLEPISILGDTVHMRLPGETPMVDEVIFPAEFHADHFDHPELRQLAKALPAVLVCDHAASTVATYLGAYKSWKSWASHHDAAILPADPVVFTLYIVSLIQQTWSVSSVNSAVYGVSWVHKKSGYQEPSE